MVWYSQPKIPKCQGKLAACCAFFAFFFLLFAYQTQAPSHQDAWWNTYNIAHEPTKHIFKWFQSNTDATPIHHSQMPPQLSVVTCLNGAVSTPLWVRWPIFWGGWEKWYASKREKVGCFFCWKGPLFFFEALGTQIKKICFTRIDSDSNDESFAYPVL